MSLPVSGTYGIHFTNSSYIQAIIKYNQKASITKITDSQGNITEDLIPMDQLALIIQSVSAASPTIEGISIEYSSYDSLSMFGVFPILPPQQGMKPVSPLAASYLRGLVRNSTGTGRPCMILPKHPSMLSRDEVIGLIQQYDCSGAIELPELNTVVFQYEAACFYLTYGNPCKIGNMSFIRLDIDDGFVYLETDDPQVDRIASVLQKHFIRWKKQNYEGPLFAENMALHSESTAHVAATAAPSGFGLFSGGLAVLEQVKGSFARFFKAEERVTIGVKAFEIVNFAQIDYRITQTELWGGQCTPISTEISVPRQHAEEIIKKLLALPQISTVAGKLTPGGAQYALHGTRPM
jgi:hypothetical protein